MSAPPPSEPVGVGEVWEELHTPLLGFILAHVRDRDLAEDLLQDVMVGVHRHTDVVERGYTGRLLELSSRIGIGLKPLTMV